MNVRACSRAIAVALIGMAGIALSVLSVAPASQAGAQSVERVPARGNDLGTPAAFRRLSETQYKRSIALIFGEEISVPGRFEPPLRKDGLLAIGDNNVSVSSSGFEQYELRAREIASQVMAPDRRGGLKGCKPANTSRFDRACASEFFAYYGRLLYRRPLSPAELDPVTKLAAASASAAGDHYKGLETGLARLLVSPNFLFRIERTGEGNWRKWPATR